MSTHTAIKLLWRVLFIILALIPVVFYKEFAQSFFTYFTGGNLSRTIRGEWNMVALNILFFVSFLLPLSFRRKANWTEKGLVVAFFISLFVEMYGIPLSILAASHLFQPKTALPDALVRFEFLGVSMSMHLCMCYGAVLIALGTTLIVTAWVTLYKNIKKTNLVTNGIYSYSRHPQYLGFILIILGWLFGWHTIVTALLSPVLIIMYLRVCYIEEKEVGTNNPAYREYRQRVPFFF
jgi:protein-S-isoprenylcysteine O-methyltransferase Ste14